MISDVDLFNEFVSSKMLVYFQKKCPHLAESTLRSQLCEMLKYLILTEHFPGNIIFGKEIDDLWHLWIMQTRQYDELCKKMPGGFFRHHSSKDYPEEPVKPAQQNGISGFQPSRENADTKVLRGVEAIKIDTQSSESEPSIGSSYIKAADRGEFIRKAERIISFFVTYQRNFGNIREEVIPFWPPLERMVERLGWDAKSLNAFLQQQNEHATIVAAQ